MLDNIVIQVFVVALLTDLATGLGALPFAFVRHPSVRWQGIASAVAGGMMISASVFSLADQALRRGSVWEVVLGMLAGAAFFAWIASRVEDNEWRIANLNTVDSRQAVLIVVTMFIHNIPEGMAVTLPLRAKGVSLWRCAWYAILTSVPQPLLAVPSFLLVSVFMPLLPSGLGFAGGAMIYLVAAELIPDSLRGCSRQETAWGVIVGLVLMLLITSGLGL